MDKKHVLAALFALLTLFLLYRASTLAPSDSDSESSEELQRLRRRVLDLETHIKDTVETQLKKTIDERLDAMHASTGNINQKAYPVTTKLPYGKQKRILVTGGAGFVGSNLVDRLMAQGHHVTVIDNFFTGRRENIDHWMGHPNFALDNHDVVNPYMIEVDEIYHLACPASPPHYQFNPIKTIKTSTMGTLNMLGLAMRVKARMLFTSTSEVYGDPQEHPQKETYWGNVNPMGPRACYDEGKRVAETMCYSYQHEAGVEVRIARIFNTFGPRMHPDDGRVVSNFIIQALQGKPLTVFGDGQQTRSFQFVSDLVEGLMALMASNVTTPVNIGNPQETTILEFAKFIQQEVNPDSTIKHLPPTEDDPHKRKPDIAKANKYLSWQPKVEVIDGIRTTVQYFKQQLGYKTDKHTTIWI